jgi:hypothetical protein
MAAFIRPYCANTFLNKIPLINFEFPHILSPSLLGYSANGSLYSAVCATATDITAHRCVNIAVSGITIRGEKSDGGHDLTRLTITTLRNAMISPGNLDGMISRF